MTDINGHPQEDNEQTKRVSPGDIHLGAQKASVASRAGQPGRPPQSAGRTSGQQHGNSAGTPVQRSTHPVLPEHSAIADELRMRLRGKPTHAAHNRSWYSELWSVIYGVLKVSLVLILCLSFIIGGFGAGMLVGYISTTTAVDIADLRTSNENKTSFVYDSKNNEIARLTGVDNIDRVYVSFSEIKGTYIDEAIVAIEDERFIEHSGIDVQRIASAVLSTLFSVGSSSHGGSTITQQTVKLVSGQDERSAQRKVQEWYRAMWLEQEMTKDEILDLYVNLAPMGNNYVGVQAAARNYFGKDAKELTLPECAFLAGLPKSPSYYNPLRESGKRNAMRRMRIVLGKMHELKMITDEEYQSALNTELIFKTTTTTTATKITSYFVEYALSEVILDLQTNRNISEELAKKIVYSRGYKIYTTLEPEVQSVMDEAFLNQSLFQNDPEALEDLPEKPQGGMVVINVQTGAIAGMQGGYGEKNANLVTNRAVSAYRQPGSSIKPLIDYAPAIEVGIIVPATMYDDKESYLDPKNPGTRWPKNADGAFKGIMTIRKAVTSSRNTIAVQVWTDLGADTALWFLKGVGIDRTNETYPSTAIGGFNKGMTPLEMAAAYATFPNKGDYREPYSYTKVLDADGNVVLETRPTPVQVYSEETAFIMSDILKGVITGGTATGHVHTITNANGESIAVAGKTGTTEVDIKDIRDKWFCGYTPYYAAAVWYGYDNRLRTTAVPKIDQYCAQNIWDYVMQRIHVNLPGADFEKPEGVIYRTVCKDSGQLATQYCKEAGAAVTDYFISGDYLTPSSSCTFHVEPTPTPTPTPPPTEPTTTP